MSAAVLAILNPTSGKGRSARVWWKLRRLLEGRFPHLVVQETTGPGDAGARSAAWAGAGHRGPILVVGGDGTIHEVVNALHQAGSSVPVGVIPSGTGNDFARNAGIPLDPYLAAERLLSDAARPFDLGRIRYRAPDGAERGIVFVNSASVGVSPAANRYAQWLGYVPGGVVALLTEARRHFTVREAGRLVHEGKALNITMANGPEFGGGLRISPDSSPTDGTLERVVIGPIGPLRALLAFARLGRGTHVGMREVAVSRVSGETTIAWDGTLHVEADGHDYVIERGIAVSIEAGALRVLGVSGER